MLLDLDRTQLSNYVNMTSFCFLNYSIIIYNFTIRTPQRERELKLSPKALQLGNRSQLMWKTHGPSIISPQPSFSFTVKSQSVKRNVHPLGTPHHSLAVTLWLFSSHADTTFICIRFPMDINAGPTPAVSPWTWKKKRTHVGLVACLLWGEKSWAQGTGWRAPKWMECFSDSAFAVEYLRLI